MFSVILATDLDFGIGKKNTIPWHLPNDLKRFKRLTSEQVVVMGRRTWDSLPKKPLPNRINIIVSSTPSDIKISPSIITVSSISELLVLRDQIYLDKEWFIIGGAQLYDIFLNSSYINKVYWTLIFERYECDTRIKTFIPDAFQKGWYWSCEKSEGLPVHINCTISKQT